MRIPIEERISLFKMARDDKIKHILIRVEEMERKNPGKLMIEHIRHLIRRQYPTLSEGTVKEWSKIAMSHLLDMRGT